MYGSIDAPWRPSNQYRITSAPNISFANLQHCTVHAALRSNSERSRSYPSESFSTVLYCFSSVRVVPWAAGAPSPGAHGRGRKSREFFSLSYQEYGDFTTTRKGQEVIYQKISFYLLLLLLLLYSLLKITQFNRKLRKARKNCVSFDLQGQTESFERIIQL